MSEINQKILDMINKGASVNEITSSIGLSNRQLFYRLSLLKIKGYDFKMKYYYNGDIVYKLKKNLDSVDNAKYILTSPNDTEFKALFVSDFHMGSKRERLDLIDKIYDYCVKEGINIIINAGDLITGLFGRDEKEILTNDKQIDHALKMYPFDKSILTFICLGNHDYDSLSRNGQNLANAILNKRHDIIPIGYGKGVINVKNDQIIVKHSGVPVATDFTPYENKLILTGGLHKYKTVIGGDNSCNIYLPTLSDLKFTSDEILPGVIKATLKYTNGYFDVGNFEHLLVSSGQIYKIGESEYYLGRGKNISTETVKYEEVRKPYVQEINQNEEKSKVKVLKQQNVRLSQIDKFNMRLNNEKK